MYTLLSLIGEREWRSGGEPSPPDPTNVWPGLKSRRRRHQGLCLFSPLLREIFLWVLQFSALIKSQRCQSPIRPWMAEEEPVCECSTSKSFFTTSKLLFIYLFIFLFILSFLDTWVQLKVLQSNKLTKFKANIGIWAVNRRKGFERGLGQTKLSGLLFPEKKIKAGQGYWRARFSN